MEQLSERAGQLKGKWPGYGPLLEFYVEVRKLQAASRGSVRVDPARAGEAREGGPPGAGSSLVVPKDFPVDLEGSTDLFRSLLRLCRDANPQLAAKAATIEQALVDDTLDLRTLMAGGGSEQEIARTAGDRGLDAQILWFLVRSSARPSIEAASERLRGELDLESPGTGHCPVCGSPPALNLLKGDGGRRYSLCSRCACQWRVDRLACPVCGNKEPAALHYFCDEGEEARRIDLCDACRHYTKTIDVRCLGEADPVLEDLATLHLDVVAVQKGYARAGSDPVVAALGFQGGAAHPQRSSVSSTQPQPERKPQCPR